MGRCLVRGAAIALGIVGAAAFAQSAVELTHVHGLSFSADGRKLVIPSHHGLAVYEGGKWAKAPGPQHDYMGYSATRQYLYSSGHPAPGSGLINPFGLIRSRDGAKTWDKLGLEGESDFHLLAASWNTNAVYVWSPAPNSRMRSPGLHFTLNDGMIWRRASAAGLSGDPHGLAVHPDDPAIVAVSTSTGVFLSKDSGERFTPVASGVDGLAVFIDLDGKYLWFARFEDGSARLARIPIGGGAAMPVALPPLVRDAVSYIAQNPASRNQYAIATFNRNVFLSSDEGSNWKQIARDGNGI